VSYLEGYEAYWYYICKYKLKLLENKLVMTNVSFIMTKMSRSIDVSGTTEELPVIKMLYEMGINHGNKMRNNHLTLN
jgi:hypothetical protein